jgi:hypothetical protein
MSFFESMYPTFVCECADAAAKNAKQDINKKYLMLDFIKFCFLF